MKIESLFEHIKLYMYDEMISIYDDFEKFLKQELAKWGCIIGNSLCMEMANNQLQLYLKNPKKK